MIRWFAGRREGRWLLLFALLLTSLLAVGPAEGGGISERSAATRSALAALGVNGHSGPEIVFGPIGPLPAGTVVREGGPARPRARGLATTRRSPVVARAKGASWLFYEDLAPFQQYEHAGRLALVNVHTGRVSLSGSLNWPPVIGGQLPAFLRSQSAYDSGRDRAFYRPYQGASVLAASDGAEAGRLAARSERHLLDPALAAPIARLLAAQHACVVRASDTVPGGYYAFANIAQSRAALDYRFAQLSSLAPGFRSVIYPGGRGAIGGFVADQIAANGCKDVLLYLAGGGYRQTSAINVGLGLAGQRVLAQDVTVSSIASLARSHPDVTFEVALDAPGAAGFRSLMKQSNVLLVATPQAPGGGAFTYLPEALVGGRLVPNQTDPLHLLQFTDRLLFGLSSAIGSPSEVAKAVSLTQAGKLRSLLAYLLTRGFAAGGGVDFVTATGVGAPPVIQTGGPTVTGGNLPPAGVADAASTDKHTAVEIPVLANDSDPDGDSLSVASVDTSGTRGKVTINPSGTIHYDPGGQFENLNVGQTATDHFTYKASDGSDQSGATAVTVTITGSNDSPTLSGLPSSPLSYEAGSAAIKPGAPLVVQDPDDAELHGATVKISSGLAAGEDSLGFSDQHGITGSYDASTGVLTLSGTASLADYQTALQSVTYSDAHGASPSTATRTISFQVDDGHSSNDLSNVASRDVSVFPNLVPIAANDSASTDKATAINIPVLANDGDSDGDPLRVDPASLSTAGTHGLVSVNSDGTIHYDPNGQFNGLQQGQTATDSFSYKVSDGYQDSSPATVTVTVNGVNEPPELSSVESSPLQYDAATAPAAVTSTLALGDVDDTSLSAAKVWISSGFVAAQDSLSFTNQNGITGSYNSATGVLTLSGSSSLANYQAALRSIAYGDSNGANPNPATRTISFQADDGHPSNHLSATVTRNVSVDPNPAPTGVADNASTNKHTAIDIAVLANDSDSDGEALHVDPASIDTTGTHGTVSLNPNGTIHYDPNGQFENLNAGQTATDTFTYKSSDGYHDSPATTVTVTITGLNDPPVLSNIESSVLPYDAGTTAVSPTSTLTVSDPDDSSLAGATVSIASGFVAAEDSLSFTNQNGISGSYNAATGVLTLTGNSSLANYQTALRSVRYGDSNGTNPTTGTRTITFQADDGAASNNLSAPVSRSVSVNPNPPPTANNDSASTNKHAAADIPVLANDSDSDGDSLHVASVDATGTLGSVSVNGDGTIHYDPNGQFDSLQQGQTATDTFTYKASDGFHDSNSATVTVTVTGTNDPPVLSGMESSALPYGAGNATPVTGTLTVSDVDDTSLAGATVRISSGLAAGEDSLNFTNQNGITGSYDSSTGVLTLSGASSIANYQTALRSVTYKDSNASSPSTTPRTISFQADDGHTSNNLSNVASRTVDVTANTPPTANDDSTSTGKHTATDINVLANDSDPDGDTLHVASVDTTGTLGSVSVNPDGTIHYDPNGQFDSLQQGQSATDTFSYQASDGHSNSNSATVTVTINGSNDPPVLSGIETSTLSYRAQDPAIPITSTLTASDDDDTTLAGATVSITSGFSSSADQLSFVNQSGITGSYNSSTGVLTLSGTSSIANYQAALRSVTFATSDGSASPAARTISFTATDPGTATSNTVTRQVNVAEANQAPVASTDSYTAVGNTPLAVGTTVSGPAVTDSGASVLSNDSDPDSSAPLTVTNNSSPAHGTVTMNANGTFTYTPNTGYSGADSFTYTISDSDDSGNPKTATGTVNVTVGPVVWYVDNSLGSAGNGTSATPFNTLPPANSAAGSNSVVFLYQGSGNYTGGVSMQSGEQLLGQPNGLTLSGHTIVAPGGSTPKITNSSGDGIDLAAGADVEGVNVSSPSGNGIGATNVNAATVGATTPVAVSGAGGDGIHVSGGSGALSLAQTSVTGSTGHSVSISSRTGGTTTLGGNISDTGTGVSLSSNTGATIGFTGRITASTGANTAFSATGGGTVSATTAGSTLATTTGTALNVAGTTIGSSGLNFQSISANGASSGITLNATGSSGSLSVTGTGAASSGGTIQNASANAIALSSTSSPSFNDMTISNPQHDGVTGTGVSGFRFTNGSITGAGAAANTAGDSAIGFDQTSGGTQDNLDGAVTITGNTISGSYGHGIDIENFNGTISDANISGNNISSATTASNSKGTAINVNMFGNGSTVANLTKGEFESNTITNFPSGDGINVQGGNNTSATAPSGTYGIPGSSTNIVTISGNFIHGTATGQCFSGTAGCMNGQAINVAVTGLGQGNFNITGNGTAGQPLGETIGVTLGVLFAGNVTANAAVTNNIVSANNSLGSDGIGVSTDKNTQASSSVLASPQAKFTVTGNTVSHYDGTGINFLQSYSNGTADLKMDNNTTSAPESDDVTGPGVQVSNGFNGDPTSYNPTLCSDISANTAAAGNPDSFGDGVPGIVVNKGNTSAASYPFELAGLSSPQSATQPSANAYTVPYVANNNPNSAQGVGFYAGVKVDDESSDTAGSADSFTSCTLPTMP